MVLENLKLLYRSMKNQNIQRYTFHYQFLHVNFDVFFMTDITPYILGFGTMGYNFYFEIRVEPGFKINPILGPEDYRTLVKILGLKYDPANPFKISNFFQDFNSHIPMNAIIRNSTQPHHLIHYRKNVEEIDKKYFCGWLHHYNKNNGSVSEQNLEKTKQLLSELAAIRCRQYNISSKWTDDQTKAIDFYMPEQ